MALEAGDEAPQFTLPADGGRSVTLDGFLGRKLVLYAYPKDATPGCTQEAIDFNRLKADFAAADADILGLSPDPARSHDRFKARQALDIALASDESLATLQAYGVWTEKSLYGRRFMGVERTTFLIDRKGTIARIWRKVKVPGHAEEVLAAVRELE